MKNYLIPYTGLYVFQNIQTTEKFYVDKLSVTFSKASVENGPFSDIDRVIYFIVTRVH